MSGGVGTGGAIGKCAKLAAGGAWQTSTHTAVHRCARRACCAPELSPTVPPPARAAFKMIVDAIVKQTEHKTTRKPCDDFRSEVYHLGEFTGRGIASLAVAQAQEEELVERYGMKSDALRQGGRYFSSRCSACTGSPSIT